ELHLVAERGQLRQLGADLIGRGLQAHGTSRSGNGFDAGAAATVGAQPAGTAWRDGAWSAGGSDVAFRLSRRTSSATRSRRDGLPSQVSGSSSRISIVFGCSNGASLSRRNARSSAAVTTAPSFGRTKALIVSPR